MAKTGAGDAALTLADMQGAPTQLTVRGVEIQVHPLPLRDWARFDRWLREETMRMCLRAADEAPLAQRGDFIREAVGAATGVSIANPDALRGMLGSIGGMLKVIFASLRRGGNEALMTNRKALTEDDVDRFLGNDMEAMATIAETVVALSFPSAEEEGQCPPAEAAGNGGE